VQTFFFVLHFIWCQHEILLLIIPLVCRLIQRKNGLTFVNIILMFKKSISIVSWYNIVLWLFIRVQEAN